mgnify:CR=1 FL=1
MEEEVYENLKEEIEEFNKEKNRIKDLMGRIGGQKYSKRDMILNIIFLAVIVVLFILEFTIKIIPTLMALEIGVLLVSIKIIFMIHTQQKTNHYQFWVLNSIEFRVNELYKRVRNIEKSVEKKE